MVYDAVKHKLEQSGIKYLDHEHEPIRTVQDAIDKWPFGVDNLVKTVAFKNRDECIYLVAVLAQARIDYKKLAAELGVSRRDISTLSPDEVKSQLGTEPGGVCPIPLRDDIQVILDKEIAKLDRIFCGFGRLDHTLELVARDLITVSNGRLASVSK